jgi:hypothetical protein
MESSIQIIYPLVEAATNHSIPIQLHDEGDGKCFPKVVNQDLNTKYSTKIYKHRQHSIVRIEHGKAILFLSSLVISNIQGANLHSQFGVILASKCFREFQSKNQQMMIDRVHRSEMQ